MLQVEWPQHHLCFIFMFGMVYNIANTSRCVMMLFIGLKHGATNRKEKSRAHIVKYM